MSKVIAVVSGGLDSTTMVYDLLAQGHEVECVSFDYGQRHKKELAYAAGNARLLDLRHDIVDLTALTHLISNSALTSQLPEYPTAVDLVDGPKPVEVPDGHYAEDNMKLTVVPNRNMIMLSIAAGIAVNRSADNIATAVHSGDHFIYPDCRPRFIAATNAAIVIGNQSFGAIPDVHEGQEIPHFIWTPFLHASKADIAYKALSLSVPLHLTWSCYKGGNNHCGRCGTCVERLEAIDDAARRFTREHGWAAQKDGKAPLDATVYDDDEYWKIVIAKADK